MFFTGNRFDILISTAMCVEPQMEYVRYMNILPGNSGQYDIKYWAQIFRFRSLLRVVGTLNSDTAFSFVINR